MGVVCGRLSKRDLKLDICCMTQMRSGKYDVWAGL
jgi:hypothetical protein